MEKEKGQSHFWSVIIVAIVMSAYVLSGVFSRPVAADAGVMYRSDGGVVLECVLDWNASRLDDLLNTAENFDIPLNIFVSCDWAENNADTLSFILANGNTVGLLVTGSSEGFETEINRGKELIGKQLLFVTASNTKDDEALGRAADRCGLEAVLCTYELKNNTTDVDALIQRVKKETFKGAIIRFDPAKTTVDGFSQIIDVLKSEGYTIVKLIDEK